jgi:hypothetical protein
MITGKHGSNPSVSGNLARFDPDRRRVLEAIEKERVRQGVPMLGVDISGKYNAVLSSCDRDLKLKTLLHVLKSLEIQMILVNREGKAL